MPESVDTVGCCRVNMPPYSGYTQDGATFTCHQCLSRWVWVEDEAEGGGWERDTWGVAETALLIDGSGVQE